MSASKIRTDYEQLTQIAQAFGQQAEAAQRMLDAVQQDMSTLHGGDWVGKGAETFYAEMNAVVLPAVRRLVAAMKEAASTTANINRVMKQAEDDSAALFRLDGQGTGAPAEASSGTTGGLEAGDMESGSETSSGGSPVKEVSAFTPKFANTRHDPAGLGGTPPRTLSPKVKEMLAELDPQVVEWAKLSPTLMLQLEAMAARGAKFSTRPGAIEQYNIPPGDAKTQFQALVLVAALDSYQVLTPPPAGESRDEYIKREIQNRAKLEGAVMFNQIAVWNDNDAGILHRPQDKAGFPMKPAEFAQGRRIYGEWVAGNLSTEDAFAQLGAIRGQQVVKTPTSMHTLQDEWQAEAERRWEES
jgi:WXG100 family type VII secretion target